MTKISNQHASAKPQRSAPTTKAAHSGAGKGLVDRFTQGAVLGLLTLGGSVGARNMLAATPNAFVPLPFEPLNNGSGRHYPVGFSNFIIATIDGTYDEPTKQATGVITLDTQTCGIDLFTDKVNGAWQFNVTPSARDGLRIFRRNGLSPRGDSYDLLPDGASASQKYTMGATDDVFALIMAQYNAGSRKLSVNIPVLTFTGGVDIFADNGTGNWHFTATRNADRSVSAYAAPYQVVADVRQSQPLPQGADTPADASLVARATSLSFFGNTTIHPEAIGFYVLPAINGSYTGSNATQGSGCQWPTLLNTLKSLRRHLPDAWLRWDNETGAKGATPADVEAFVQCVGGAKIPMTVTASAVDGYVNFWANNQQQPPTTLLDVARGPYIDFAYQLMQKYDHIKMLQTFNEPDGPWFLSNNNSASDFSTYLNAVLQRTGDMQRVLGPSTSVPFGAIWDSYINRTDVDLVAYHAYYGQVQLFGIQHKRVWITEYGGFGYTPADVLADLALVERRQTLSGSIDKLFYSVLLDADQTGIEKNVVIGAFDPNSADGQGGHGMRGWAASLKLYSDLGSISKNAYTDGHQDFVAVDDQAGGFGFLYWNNQSSSAAQGARQVPNSSLRATTPLFASVVANNQANALTCTPLGSNPWASVSVGADQQVSVGLNGVPPKVALLLSTRPCDTSM